MRLWFSQAHTTLLFHLPPRRLVILSPSRRSMTRCERAVLLFTKKWLPTWHSTVHHLPTWILSAFRPVFLPVIFLPPSPTWSAFLPPAPHSSSSSPLLSSFHQITSSQSSAAIRDVSFNHASSSAYFFPLYFLYSYLSLTSSSQSPVSSKCSGRLRSQNVSVCLNWK